MPNKKINQLDARVGGSLTDLSLIGDPTTGTSFKLTLTQISTIMGVPGKFNQPTGTTLQYLRGDGTLATFPILTGFVPYTGSTQGVNLGAYDLLVQTLTIGKGNNSLVNNTALGYQVLNAATIGNFNTGVGYQSLHSLTSGQYNTAIGQSSLFSANSAAQNTAIGVNSLLYTTSGGSNVAIGLDTLQHNTTGSSNTAIGYNAGSHITGGSTPNTTASNSVYIGRDSKAKADGGTNEIVIGQNAVGNGSNTATFGNTATTANYFTGSINGGSFVKSGGLSTEYLKADGSVSTLTNPITGTGASGQVAYFTGASTQVGSNNLFWDNTNGRLGIGTTTPSNSLHITQSASIATSMRMANTRVTESYVTSIYASGIYNATSGFTTSNAPFEIGLYTSTTVSANADGIYIGRSGLNFNFLLNKNGNLLLQNGGTFNDSGQRLQVTGTMLVTGASTFGGNMTLSLNQNDATNFTITNTTAGSFSTTLFRLVSNSLSGSGLFGKRSSSTNVYKTLESSDFQIYNDTVAGDISILNDFASGSIKFAAGSSSTAQMRLTTVGRLILGAGDSGELLQVNGTAKFGGNMALTFNQNNATNFTITNTTAGSFSTSFFQVISDSLSGSGFLGKRSSTTTVYKSIASSDLTIYNGTVAGDISILNDVVTGRIKFAAGASSTAQMTLHATGNLSIGAISDSTQRLQVTGDTLLKGSGATSATSALIVQNSSSTELFRVYNDGQIEANAAGSSIFVRNGITFGATSAAARIAPSASNAINVRFTQGNTNLLGAYGGGIQNSSYLFSYPNSNNTDAFTNSLFGIIHTFNPTSGTSGYIMSGLQPTINQTGGANGITRGLYVNPTLTAAADWRSIEWSNNTGWGLYGAGTANNYLGGRLGIGTNTPQSNIQISENKNGITSLQISNTTAGTASQAGIRLDSDTSSGTMNLGKYSSTSLSYLSILPTDGYLSNANFGDIVLQNEVVTGRIKFAAGASSTAQMILTAAGRLGIGTITPQTNIQISDNKNGITSLQISNTTAGSSSQSGIRLDSDASSGTMNLGKYSSTSNSYLSISSTDGYLSNANFGDIVLQNEVVTGRIKFAAGASSTAQMILHATGNLAIGSTSDTTEKLQVNGTMKVTEKLSMGAGTTARAQINLASGTAPTSPNNGDIWFDGTNLKMQIGGVTKTFTLI